MTSRPRELFELLKSAQDGAEDAQKPSRKKETGRKPRTARQTQDTRVGQRVLGGRKVPISINLLLIFLGAFIIGNVCSYMVGKQIGGSQEIPLSVEVKRYWAVQVTPWLDEKNCVSAWKLKDLLVEAGYEGAEVHRLPDSKYIRTVAAIYDYDKKAICQKTAAELKLIMNKMLKAANLRGDIISIKPVKIIQKESMRAR